MSSFLGTTTGACLGGAWFVGDSTFLNKFEVSIFLGGSLFKELTRGFGVNPVVTGYLFCSNIALRDETEDCPCAV